jgi:hypothetical protein
MVSLVDIEPAFFYWYTLSPGGTGSVGLPMSNVSECIFDCPGVFGFRAEQQTIPFFVGKIGNELIEKFKLLDSTLDNFLTVVAHGRETSCVFVLPSGLRPALCVLHRVLALGRAWTMFGSRKNPKPACPACTLPQAQVTDRPEKKKLACTMPLAQVKMRQNPTRQVHALLGAFYTLINT